MSITETIRVFHDELADNKHHRYKSWEHCYTFFQQVGPSEIEERLDEAALNLGFYLASWGMYRPSGFLLQHTYTTHNSVVAALAEFPELWQSDFGSSERDSELIPSILQMVKAVRNAYKPFGPATDTLVTKVLLGTLGCLPACDRFFKDGFRSRGLKFSRVNARFAERLLKFCGAHITELRAEQARIRDATQIEYPLMKLVDMYFWQLGFELNNGNGASDEIASA